MPKRWMAVAGLAALPAALLYAPAFGQEVPAPPELPGSEQHCGEATVIVDGQAVIDESGCIPPDGGEGSALQLCGDLEADVNGETLAVGGCIPPEDGGEPPLPDPGDLPEPPDPGLPDPGDVPDPGLPDPGDVPELPELPDLSDPGLPDPGDVPDPGLPLPV